MECNGAHLCPRQAGDSRRIPGHRAGLVVEQDFILKSKALTIWDLFIVGPLLHVFQLPRLPIGCVHCGTLRLSPLHRVGLCAICSCLYMSLYAESHTHVCPCVHTYVHAYLWVTCVHPCTHLKSNGCLKEDTDFLRSVHPPLCSGL